MKKGILPQVRDFQIKMEFLTVADVAAESNGKIPPQAMIMLSITWEMRWIVLCTNTTLSLLFTKSITVFVEWLSKNLKMGKKIKDIQNRPLFLVYFNIFLFLQN